MQIATKIDQDELSDMNPLILSSEPASHISRVSTAAAAGRGIVGNSTVKNLSKKLQLARPTTTPAGR